MTETNINKKSETKTKHSKKKNDQEDSQAKNKTNSLWICATFNRIKKKKARWAFGDTLFSHICF